MELCGDPRRFDKSTGGGGGTSGGGTYGGATFNDGVAPIGSASFNPLGVSFNTGNAKLEYAKMDDFSLPSQDNYSVASQGMTGAFKPFSYYSVVAYYCADNEYHGDYYRMRSSTPKSTDLAVNYARMKFSPEFNEGLVFKMLNEANYNLVDNPEYNANYFDASARFHDRQHSGYVRLGRAGLTGQGSNPCSVCMAIRSGWTVLSLPIWTERRITTPSRSKRSSL